MAAITLDENFPLKSKDQSYEIDFKEEHLYHHELWDLLLAAIPDDLKEVFQEGILKIFVNEEDPFRPRIVSHTTLGSLATVYKHVYDGAPILDAEVLKSNDPKKIKVAARRKGFDIAEIFALKDGDFFFQEKGPRWWRTKDDALSGFLHPCSPPKTLDNLKRLIER